MGHSWGVGGEIRRREPPLTLRQEKQYQYFGHLFPCTPGPFSLQYGPFSEEFPQSRPCTTRIWVCATGWRLALYLCSPIPALGLRVVVYRVRRGGVPGMVPLQFTKVTSQEGQFCTTVLSYDTVEANDVDLVLSLFLLPLNLSPKNR